MPQGTAQPAAAPLPASCRAASRRPPKWSSSAGPATDQPRQGWDPVRGSFGQSSKPARPAVWQIFADIPAVAACLPRGRADPSTMLPARKREDVGEARVRSPASFVGSAAIRAGDRCGIAPVSSAAPGGDRGTGSRTQRGTWTYRSRAGGLAARHTRVILTVEYSLQGALAQFLPVGLSAQDFGRPPGR